jgi:hypothetical protein
MKMRRTFQELEFRQMKNTFDKLLIIRLKQIQKKLILLQKKPAKLTKNKFDLFNFSDEEQVSSDANSPYATFGKYRTFCNQLMIYP